MRRKVAFSCEAFLKVIPSTKHFPSSWKPNTLDISRMSLAAAVVVVRVVPPEDSPTALSNAQLTYRLQTHLATVCYSIICLYILFI